MRQQDVFASAQLLVFHPILKESLEVRTQYFLYLRKLVRLVKWRKRKYTKAQIAFYRKTLCGENGIPRVSQDTKIPTRMCYLIPYDLALMLAYQQEALHSEKIVTIINKIISDHDLPPDSADFFYREFDAALGDKEAWREVFVDIDVFSYKRYLKIVRDNIFFIRESPYNILITANMSAGKSTLINALVGKNVSRVQNMACTSKIHTIISKPFEDGTTSKSDHDISMDADKKELFTNNDENLSPKISVGTYFNSMLGGQRIILFDSPGVNSSENKDHREISLKTLRSRKYKLLIYVMNATQLGTDDEARYLDEVKKEIGRAKVIFVINKIDCLNPEDENIYDVIENQRGFLTSKGFKNPIICPVSAYAAYLVKKSQQEELKRYERREMYACIDKFTKHSLAAYYEEYLRIPSLAGSKNEFQDLLKDCFGYLKQIIKHLSNGSKNESEDRGFGYWEQIINPLSNCSKNESEDLLKDCGFGYLEQIIKHLSNGGNIWHR